MSFPFTRQLYLFTSFKIQNRDFNGKNWSLVYQKHFYNALISETLNIDCVILLLIQQINPFHNWLNKLSWKVLQCIMVKWLLFDFDKCYFQIWLKYMNFQSILLLWNSFFLTSVVMGTNLSSLTSYILYIIF